MKNIHYNDLSAPHNEGELNAAQADALCPHVLGRHVHDLGAGKELALTSRLLALGARYVTAVDHAFPDTVSPYGFPLHLVSAYFHDYTPAEPLEVALVSWPSYLFLDPPAPHILYGLVKLCAASPVVVYLGSNFGTVCGNLELWRHLATREVLTHVPDPRNTLIVYGRKNARIPGQGLLPEEKAALYRHVTPLPVYGVTYG